MPITTWQSTAGLLSWENIAQQVLCKRTGEQTSEWIKQFETVFSEDTTWQRGSSSWPERDFSFRRNFHSLPERMNLLPSPKGPIKSESSERKVPQTIFSLMRIKLLELVHFPPPLRCCFSAQDEVSLSLCVSVKPPPNRRRAHIWGLVLFAWHGSKSNCPDNR